MAVAMNESVDSFFKQQAQFGKFHGAIIIVALAGLAWGMKPVATFYTLEPDVRIDIQNAVAADWIVHFLLPIFIWLYFWAAFALLTQAFGGRMRMGRLFKLTGWGMSCFLLVGAVRAAGRYYAFSGAELPMGSRRGVMQSEFNAYQALVGETLGDPILVGATLVSCLFLLVGAYIWYYAVKYSTDLAHRQIRVVVAIPILLYVAYSVANSFTIIGYM